MAAIYPFLLPITFIYQSAWFNRLAITLQSVWLIGFIYRYARFDRIVVVDGIAQSG